MAIVEGDDDVIYSDVAAAEKFDEADDFGLVRDDAVGTDFGFFDIAGIDAEDDFDIVTKFLDEANFEIWLKAWEDTGGVVVVYEFAAKFDVEFVKEGDALLDTLFLEL